MLRVLDAPAAVALPVRFFDLLEHIQNHGYTAVSDSVNAYLQARCVGALQSLQHGPGRMHLVTEQAVALRIVGIGVEEVRGFRSQRAIGVTLDGPHAQQRRPESAANADS